MTRAEAIQTLQANAKLLHFEHPHLGIKEAIEVVIEALSQPSLPSDLDEAAEAYRKKVYCGDSEMCQFVREVFKAGAQWRDAQIPKLPDSIDEAAEEYGYINWQSEDYHEGASEGLPFDAIGHTEKCFKAGAKWAMRQGETVFGIVTKVGDKLDVETTEYLIPEESEFERGDKVVIQIRKQ